MSRQHHGLTLAAVSVSALAFSLAIPLVIPALPDIQEEYGASAAAATFVLTGFMLTASVATPIIGRLGDMFGKDRLLLVTMALFGLGAVVSALASSIEILVAGRLIQGIGAGVFPLAFGIIRDEFPADRIPAGIGLVGSIFGIGGLGLVLSGVLVDTVGTRWIFWCSAAMGALAFVVAWRWVPESPIKSPARVDWGGAALMSAGLVALLAAISQGNTWGWTSLRVTGLIAVGLAILAVWVGYERRQPEPLVPMDEMVRPEILLPNLISFLVGFSLFGSFILVSQYVQTPESAGYGFGATATEAGLFLAPSSVGMLVGGPVCGWLVSRLGGARSPLVLGVVISGTSYASLAAFNAEPWMIYGAAFLNGLGNGVVFAALPNLIIEAVAQRRSGVATGVNVIMRMAGGSLGGQIVVSVVAAHVAVGAAFPDHAGFVIAFAIEAVAVAIAGLAAWALASRRPKISNLPQFVNQ